MVESRRIAIVIIIIIFHDDYTYYCGNCATRTYDMWGENAVRAHHFVYDTLPRLTAMLKNLRMSPYLCCNLKSFIHSVIK